MTASRIWNRNWNFALLLAMTAALLLCAAAPSARADDVVLKIAICNPLKVATQVQEFKDMVEKNKSDSQNLQTEFDARKEKIKAMQDELKLLVPDSPQYAEKNDALLHYQIETEVWAKEMDMDQARKAKTNTKALFDKIQAAIAQIAQDRGYTLVLSDHSADLPEDLNTIDANTLNTLLAERTILYTDPKLDITQDVVIAMDKAYAAASH
jgi:Skp family chaperone for outer membrane proteins